jgi:mannose/fructose-specific phosphotransferase system component IIA
MRALVVTHGDLGRELVASASLVVGLNAPLDVFSNHGRSGRELREAITTWLVASEEPALIFVDEGAGSCGTAACLAAAGREDCWVLGGVNLAMIVTYLARAAELEGEALVDKILQRAQEAVRVLETRR